MKNYVFIGDLHGDYDTMVHLAREYAGKEKMIFTGDFLDSFRYDITEQILCVKLAMKLVDEGNAEVIFGNHELSYIDPENNRCSGYNPATAAHIIHMKNDMLKRFKWYIYLEKENILVTHAGLTGYFWHELEYTKDTFIAEFDKMIANGTRTRFYDVGHTRGGHNRFGGPMWCDYNHEFKPVTGLKQVFGHTAMHQIDMYKEGTNFNVDCLQKTDQVLRYDEETKVFAITPFKINRVEDFYDYHKTRLV